MKKLAALIALGLVAAPVAYAQDGQSCAGAIPLSPNETVVADTTTSTDWIASYGPLNSAGSPDLMYTFTANGSPTGDIIPTATTFPFGLYLLNGCAAGLAPNPIATTSTLNQGLHLAGLVTNGTQYWVAVTGQAFTTNSGQLTFTTPDPLPVTLQSFEIN